VSCAPLVEPHLPRWRRAFLAESSVRAGAIGLAKPYTFIGNEAWLPTKVAFERARKAASLAQQLDPKSPLPHTRLAEIYLTYDWDWAGADRELHQAFVSTRAPRRRSKPACGAAFLKKKIYRNMRTRLAVSASSTADCTR
jgi:hypothetical protein